jgi:SAM-dependent methyltransferase
VRYYILDEVVSPATGEPLRVTDARAVDRTGPQVERCRYWCGLRAEPAANASELDCRRCSQLWVEEATLCDGIDRYPVIGGIPRFVADGSGDLDRRTQASFGYEWRHFGAQLPEYDREADNYFGIVPAPLLQNAVVMDAGCGMGRWARHIVRQPVRRLYAVDFSRAIEQAAVTLAGEPRAHCIQADVCNLPFRPGTMTFSYCLGVLHHLRDPDAGMRSVARVTNGPLLVYLYYALDNRPRFHRVLLGMVTAARHITTRLPKRLMHALSWIAAALVYWPLARTARLLAALGLAGLAHQVPLSHYRSSSIRLMVADAFDRFATPIERRYTREQISAWMARYGFATTFSEHTPYWVGLGIRRS